VKDVKEPAHRIKTVTRTFRLDENLHKMLEEEGAKEKITVNSLLSKIIWNYQRRCRMCLHYNLMLIDPTVFKTLLDKLSEDEIKQAGASLGPIVLKENLARTGLSLNKKGVETAIVETMSEWTKWFDADVTETNEGRAYYLHHTLGKKWSIFLRSFFERAFADLLSLYIPIETTENSIIFTLPEKRTPENPRREQ
jgi:hypothetical protein